MPQWATFVGVTGVVLVLLLLLSHLTQSAFPDEIDESDPRPEDSRSPDAEPPGSTASDDTAATSDSPLPGETDGKATGITAADATETEPSTSAETERPADPADAPTRSTGEPSDSDATGPPTLDRTVAVEPEQTQRSADSHARRDRQIDPDDLSTGMMLANVALSQGLFALVLIGAAIYTGIPGDALGIEVSRSYVETGLLWGTAFGIALYLANEVGAAVATWFGLDHDEQLRGLLAPDSSGGWAVLLVGVLPLIAAFEELLFRAALIGVVSAGYGVDPWLLAIGSSIAFALGHGIQGTLGVVVTGVLGFVLAAGYILTGSLLVVIVAHYWINALEFVVHEGLEFDWAETIES